jgi:hypothetical protein
MLPDLQPLAHLVEGPEERGKIGTFEGLHELPVRANQSTDSEY